MKFRIVDNLGQYTVRALRDLKTEAETERDSLLASVAPETVTDEQITDLEALKAFADAVDAELSGRQARADKLAALSATTAPATAPEGEGDEEVEPEEPVAPVVAAAPVVPAAPSVADVVAVNGGTGAANQGPRTVSTLVAAADVPGFSAGQELATDLDLAKAFIARTAAYAGLGGGVGIQTHGVAVLRRELPAEFQVVGQESDQEVMLRVGNETRLPGGSLLASSALYRSQSNSLTAAGNPGWCAPSETLYDVCFQGTTDGLIDVPEVQARRGGLRTNTGIDFSTIFGSGTGFFNLTEAQVIAGSPTKTCLEIDCPSFTDTRLKANGVCLTGSILQNRGYPEYVAKFMQAAMVVHAHYMNQLQIADMVTGSTAVTLSATDPWLSDGSVLSQVMSAVEMAVVDLKYRLRLPRTATIEVKFPFWLLAQFRADWIRRNGPCDPEMADSAILAMFATRGVNPQFVYDWQDAFSAGGVGPGATTPVSVLPSTLVFLAYPAGTWIRAMSDVITLNSVYDSTKLATNQVTQLFTEEGYAMIKVCPQSRAYTIAICPTGDTGAQRSIDCVTP